MRDSAPDQSLPDDVTAVLQEWSEGSSDALAKLMPLVYEQLRTQARARLSGEREDHTLQPTALVHEAFLRLVNQKNVTWQNRAHFFSIAARMMRRVLVDHARARQSQRRGGAVRKVSLEDVEIAPEQSAAGILALDAALKKLADAYPRQGEIVEMKFFGGLAVKEISAALQVSEKTILRDWQFARLWLSRELSAEDHDTGPGAN